MRYWVAMWDEFGFESIVDITDYAPEYQAILEIAGETRTDSDFNRMLFGMKVRARANGQRNYEIYGFRSTDDVSDDNLNKWADEDPQSLVDFIRKNGVSLYNEQKSTRTPVIR